MTSPPAPPRAPRPAPFVAFRDAGSGSPLKFGGPLFGAGVTACEDHRQEKSGQAGSAADRGDGPASGLWPPARTRPARSLAGRHRGQVHPTHPQARDLRDPVQRRHHPPATGSADPVQRYSCGRGLPARPVARAPACPPVPPPPVRLASRVGGSLAFRASPLVTLVSWARGAAPSASPASPASLASRAARRELTRPAVLAAVPWARPDVSRPAKRLGFDSEDSAEII